MAYTPTTVGDAKGLLAAPVNYTNQIIGGQKYKEAQRAAKIKAEDEDLQKMLGDIKIDYNQYHRIDREPAREKYAQWLSEAYKQYQTKDPAWRTKVAMTGQQLKFDLEQLRDISNNRKQLDDLGRSGKYVKDDDFRTLYDWQQTGDYTKPPQLSGSPYSSLRNYDSQSGTANFVPVEKRDVNKFVLDSVIGDPTQYIIDPKMQNIGNKEYIYTEIGVLDPDKIRLRAHQAIGSPEFVNYVVSNQAALEQQRKANPDADPTELAVKSWEDFVVGQIPVVSKQRIGSAPGDININTGNGAPLTEQTAGYGQKPVYVYGFTSKKGEPATYTNAYDEGEESKKFQTTTIDGFTLGGQAVKISGGPNVKYLDDIGVTATGTVDMTLGDMMLVPVYKKGSTQTMGGKEVGVAGVIIPDSALKAAENAGAVSYEVMIMGNSGRKTVYSPAEQVINNATFLEEDKADKITLKNNLDILKAKRDELNSKYTNTKKEEEKPDAPSGITWK